MQLTGTNRSMTHLSAAFSGKYQQDFTEAARPLGLKTRSIDRHILAFRPDGAQELKQGGLAGLVAIARGKTPDPIPNSAVKTLCADGTAS